MDTRRNNFARFTSNPMMGSTASYFPKIKKSKIMSKTERKITMKIIFDIASLEQTDGILSDLIKLKIGSSFFSAPKNKSSYLNISNLGENDDFIQENSTNYDQTKTQTLNANNSISTSKVNSSRHSTSHSFAKPYEYYI